ncbi:hypothetical protein CN946_02800 [Bacillus sp. AFS053548]|nr:hypothetical protein CN946_02800 [Bacillus sp. AFS053548]
MGGVSKIIDGIIIGVGAIRSYESANKQVERAKKFKIVANKLIGANKIEETAIKNCKTAN